MEEEKARLAADLAATKSAAQGASEAAAERQKRFNLLNSQYRKKEAEMLQQLQATRGENEARRKEAEDALSTAAAAQEVSSSRFRSQSVAAILNGLAALELWLCRSCSVAWSKSR